MPHVLMDTSHTSPCTRHVWGCQGLPARQTRALRRLQGRCKPVPRRSKTSSQTTMQMAGAQTQRFPANRRTLSPDVIMDAYEERNKQMDPQMMQTMKEMMAVRRKVMARPGMLSLLVKQMRTAKTIDDQLKATEMVFCVVGQGPARDPMAAQQAMNEGLLPSLLGVMQDALDKPSSETRDNDKQQALLTLLLSMLAQLTVETEGEDVEVAQAATAQGGIKVLHSLFSILTGENSQQNLVSMLWHWTTLDADIRQQVLDQGIAELQVDLLSQRHSLAQRVSAAEQLCAFVTVPLQEEPKAGELIGDARLASDLIYCGAPIALVSMLQETHQHEQVRGAAAHALAALATCAPEKKMKIITAGVIQPLVAMMSKSESPKIREIGAVLLVTLIAGDSSGVLVHEQTEAAVQFASYGAIPPLVDMLHPHNAPGIRMVAITAVHILANTFDDRLRKALMSEGIIAQAMEITGMLTGRLEFDTSFDDIEMPAILDLKMKAAETLAMLAVNSQENTQVLVKAGAIQDMVLVASSDDVTDEQKVLLMKMLTNLCSNSAAVYDMIEYMMSDAS